MVGEAWIYVFYSCIPWLSNLKHCWFTIWNWMNFFFGGNIIDLRKCQELDTLDKLILSTKIDPVIIGLVVNPFLV